MDQEKRERYKEVLQRAYLDGVLKIIWSGSGFSMAVDSKQRKLIPEINEEDFVEYAFSTIKLVIDLAEERDVGKSNGDLETAKLIFQKEHDLRNHLYIKKNSKIDCFKLLEYDVISHRNEEDPGKIEATSVILKMVIEKDNEEKIYSFETYQRDLEDMIDKLVGLKEKLDAI